MLVCCIVWCVSGALTSLVFCGILGVFANPEERKKTWLLYLGGRQGIQAASQASLRHVRHVHTFVTSVVLCCLPLVVLAVCASVFGFLYCSLTYVPAGDVQLNLVGYTATVSRLPCLPACLPPSLPPCQNSQTSRLRCCVCALPPQVLSVSISLSPLVMVVRKAAHRLAARGLAGLYVCVCVCVCVVSGACVAYQEPGGRAHHPHRLLLPIGVTVTEIHTGLSGKAMSGCDVLCCVPAGCCGVSIL